MDITISLSSAKSNCVLFISVMQVVDGAQFLNITFLLVLFTAATSAAVFWNCYSSFNKYVCIT